MLQKCMGLGSSSYKSVHIVVIDKILTGHTPYLQTLLDDVLIVRSDVTMSEYSEKSLRPDGFKQQWAWWGAGLPLRSSCVRLDTLGKSGGGRRGRCTTSCLQSAMSV